MHHGRNQPISPVIPSVVDQKLFEMTLFNSVFVPAVRSVSVYVHSVGFQPVIRFYERPSCVGLLCVSILALSRSSLVYIDVNCIGGPLTFNNFGFTPGLGFQNALLGVESASGFVG